MIKIKKILVKYFKKLSYGFFSILYGKINKFSDHKVFKEVQFNEIKIGDRVYSIFKIAKSRLYTDRIHNMAVIINNTLIKGPSYQLVDNNNSKIQNNIVLKVGTPRVLKKINGNVLSLLTGGGGNDNYWHWMFDVLPRIKLSESFIAKKNINYLLVPDNRRQFQIETLENLDFDKGKILSSREYRHISANSLIITDHPYVKNNSHIETQNLPKWIIDWLRETYLKKINTRKDFPKKIFIDRSDSKFYKDKNYRNIINEEEIKKEVKKKNFETIRLTDYNFLDQVSIFSQANEILGLHGAGFSNIIFCKKNTKILELRTIDAGDMYKNLAKLSELNYNSISRKPINPTSQIQQGSIEVPINELNKLLV